MQYLLAPMEGITGFVFRRAHADCFGPADRYLTAFLSPTQTGRFSGRELADVLPAHNEGLPVVPQLLTNQADHFIWAARELASMGYKEVNLNLGCPSGTVTAKGKGAGFLGRPEELARFLDQVFSQLTLRISVKTRIGLSSPEEFPALLELFNRFPICRLDVHPRTRAELYRGTPNLSAFALALRASRAPVCYNGNLFSPAHLAALSAAFPAVERVMAGRGVAAAPALLRQFRGGPPMSMDEAHRFHDLLYAGYRRTMPGPRPTLARMKELWSYFLFSFSGRERYLRPLRKVDRLEDYEALVRTLFSREEVLPPGGLDPALL